MEEGFEFLDARIVNELSTQSFQSKNIKLLTAIKQAITKAATDNHAYETEITVDRDAVDAISLKDYLEQFHYHVNLKLDQSSRGQKIFMTIDWSNAHEY